MKECLSNPTSGSKTKVSVFEKHQAKLNFMFLRNISANNVIKGQAEYDCL